MRILKRCLPIMLFIVVIYALTLYFRNDTPVSLFLVTEEKGILVPDERLVREAEEEGENRSDPALPYELGERMYKATRVDTTELSPGLIHTQIDLEGVDNSSELKQAVNVLAIDLEQANLSAKVVSAADHITAKATVTHIAQNNESEQETVLAAFNLDFYDMSNGVPRGMQISNGEIITASVPLHFAHFFIFGDGQFHFGSGLQMEAVLQVETGEELALYAINKARDEKYGDHAFLMTDFFGPTTLSVGDGIEVLLDPEGSDGSLKPGQSYTAIVADIRESNDRPIPSGQYVLTASGKQSQWIKQHLTTGQSVTIQIDFNNGQKITEAKYAFAGIDMRALLIEGEVPFWISNVADTITLSKHPRTMIGAKDEWLYVFTFDGRQSGYADGISLREAAAYLKMLGLDHVINVDGGGSSTFVIRKPGQRMLSVVNRPSGQTQRAVANALLITATE